MEPRAQPTNLGIGDKTDVMAVRVQEQDEAREPMSFEVHKKRNYNQDALLPIWLAAL